MSAEREGLQGLLGGVMLALALSARPVMAQHTTGWLDGTVTDGAGAPLAGAQVALAGTAVAATTDEHGYFALARVPIGAYDVTVQLAGFGTVELRGARVHGALTTTLAVILPPSGARPLIVPAESLPQPRHDGRRIRLFSREQIDRLPLDDVRQALLLAPGVTEATGGGLSIRGGRAVEAGVYIDGAPVRGTNSGLQRILVGTSALEEVAVTTGPLGLEAGDARSGVISYTTRAGGPTYAGTFSYETDDLFGEGASVGWNRFEGTLGGPVPRIAHLTFFASGVLQGQRSPLLGKENEAVPRFVPSGVDDMVPDTADDGTVSLTTLPRYVQFGGECGALGSSATPLAQAIHDNYGVECHGRRIPYAWSTLVQLHGKLQYTYGGSSVSFTAMAQGDQGREYPGRAIGDPLLYSGWHAWQRLAVLNWSHELFRTSRRPLTLSANRSARMSFATSVRTRGSAYRCSIAPISRTPSPSG